MVSKRDIARYYGSTHTQVVLCVTLTPSPSWEAHEPLEDVNRDAVLEIVTHTIASLERPRDQRPLLASTE